jgi:hypothetical protein
MESIPTKAEKLLATLKIKGIDPATNLNPGTSSDDILRIASELGITLPQEVIDLCDRSAR